MVLALVAAVTCAQAGEPPAVREDEALAFARVLLAEQDPYRAVTELKRFAFLRGGPEALHAHLLIGQVYAKGKMVDASRFHFDRVISVGEPRTTLAARLLSLENVCITRILSGNCAEEIALLPDDTPLGLKQHYTRYFGVLMGAPVPSSSPAAPDLLDQLAERRAQLPVQRPWLAGLLSALLPGAGQVYNGRWLDASLAFVLTGATVAGTVALLARPQPEWGFGIPLGLLALVFYSGSIVNAVGDAFRLNEQTSAAFAKTLEAEAWPKLGLTVGPNGGTFTLTMALGSQPPRPVIDAR
jgi:hypothetical protein